MSGMFLTKEDKKKFDGWDKHNIYEAYLAEVNERQKLNKEVNRLNRVLAEIKFLAGAR